jgi:hypothetical protein
LTRINAKEHRKRTAWTSGSRSEPERTGRFREGRITPTH